MILYQHHNSSNPYNYDVADYKNFTYVPHFHRDPELVCVLEGEIRASVEDRTEYIREGEFLMILPDQVHTFETPLRSQVRVFVFGEKYVPEFRNLLKNRTCKTGKFSLPKEERTLFLKKMTPKQPHRMEICAYLSLACFAFLREREREGWREAPVKTGDLMHEIVSYIALHYTENLTLTQTAEALGYEEHYLSRCFHRYFDKNFKQFVNEYRLQHARRLLNEENGLSILEIAYASGFQSVRNFNRAYREAEGNEPRRHRKKNDE